MCVQMCVHAHTCKAQGISLGAILRKATTSLRQVPHWPEAHQLNKQARDHPVCLPMLIIQKHTPTSSNVTEVVGMGLRAPEPFSHPETHPSLLMSVR